MLKRILIISVVIIAVGYLIASMTVLNKPDEDMVCKNVDIIVLDSAQTGFITPLEVTEILKASNIYPKGKKAKYIDDKKIEQKLLNAPFIKSVECFKTPKADVRIEITQQLPILRIINDAGESYYIDERGRIMPSSKYTANVAIATGHIKKDFAKKKLVELGNFLSENDFWNKQIEQINVLPDNNIELIPRVGNHVIYFGKIDDIKEKFERLKIFYRKALNKVGWNKYSRINLEFSNQIICTK